jgi:parallel beta-helix repeat (two copies)
VSLSTNVTATFSEAMDSSTITTDSFTLAGSEVLGTVTYDSNTYTATFTPDANLDYGHVYTATLSTDITDEAGNPLAEPCIWGFTTQSGPGAKTWYVDDDGADYPDADYTKIQDAVDAANPGDTIIVYPGTYSENVDVNKDHLTIQSENGADSTIVQAANLYEHTFKITADYVSISGFTITGASEEYPPPSGSYPTGSYSGIYLSEAEHCNILDNNISDNNNGIFSSYSSYNEITGNTFTNNSDALGNGFGVYVYGSSDNIITNNNMSLNGQAGVGFSGGSNNTASGNSISNSGGIWLHYSTNNTIINNTFSKGGIDVQGFLGHWNSHTIENNTVDGKPIYYYKNMDGITVPTDAGQVILANCTNFKIQNLNLSHVDSGIILGFSSNNMVSENSISSCHLRGIDVRGSAHNKILNNTISLNDQDGILLWGCSIDNVISNNNIFSNNWAGVILRSHGAEPPGCQRNLISENNITNNRFDGISLDASSNNIISGNNIKDNHDCGITIWGSNGPCSGNKVSENNIVGNDWSGIRIYDSANNNELYLNNVINNYDNVYSSEDSTNAWHSPEKITYTYNGKTYTNYLGNYWSDYEEKYPAANEIDSTGIWDTPYSIDSDADNYPLVEGFENYVAIPTPEWRKDVHVGDVLYDKDSLYSSALGLLSIGHVGIYVGNGLTIEAESDGVDYHSIYEWDYTRKNVYLLGVSCSNEIQERTASFAMEQWGKDYDNNWLQKSSDPNSESWYCSELVWAAYYNQGIDINYRSPAPGAVRPRDIYMDNDTFEKGSHTGESELPFIAFIVLSPVDLSITDPDGLVIDKETNEIQGSIYIVGDFNDDGSSGDLIYIPTLKTGMYSITVVPEPDAKPTDIYSLEVSAESETIVLAEDVLISDIPSQPYKIQSTESGINGAPVADAGPDQTVYVTPPATTAEVTLDGSGSYDPDGDSLSYTWTWDGNTAHGVNPTVELPLGTTTMTLMVNDGKLSDSDTVDITVEQAPVPAVGGEAYPINRIAVLAPWLVLIAAIIVGATVVMLRFRLFRRRGYWVNVNGICDLTYEGHIYQLQEGWNLIGWLG